MGTRGLTKVILDGDAVVAQYGQFDHYPSGQGLKALTFLRDSEAVAALRENAERLRPVTVEELEQAWVEAGAERGSGWVTMDVSKRLEDNHPEFSRNTGSRILGLIASGEVDVVKIEPEFETDTLWCEGVVEVNLDTNEFIWRYPGYEGPMTEWRYPLNDLPTDEKFLADTEGDDEDE